ncbi:MULTISPECIES: hypothetical protein [unclassified Streptomyces]
MATVVRLAADRAGDAEGSDPDWSVPLLGEQGLSVRCECVASLTKAP